MSDLVTILIPDAAEKILDTLHENGFEAYVVGGCVRDSLLHRAPDDWDITTSASPQQVKALFQRTIDTGIEHGTVTVRMDETSFEVTTYRLDGKYADHRHPDRVEYTSSLTEDLKRRDFTINAMAYSPREGLIDLFGGMSDLEEGIVRCVGEPRERFTEDALRIMRAVRFCAQLGFSLDENTKKAAAELSPSLAWVSAERIQTELVKLITSPHPELIRLAYECGVTAQILPEFDAAMAAVQNNAHHQITVGEHIIRTLTACPKDRVLRLTMLLHDLGKPLCQTIDEQGIYHYHGHAAPSAEVAQSVMRRLKFDHATMRSVVTLVRNHSMYPEPTDAGVRHSAVKIGPELFPQFLEVKRADIRGQADSVQKKKLAYLDRVREIWEGILERDDCLSIRQLDISGNDLIAAGVKKGPEVGRVLEILLGRVLEDPTLNTRERLLEMLARDPQ